jgi:protein-S-isoprenylcysteine O-methyltransferase Ste14
MQTLFGNGAREREERGPFPVAYLLSYLAFLAAVAYWFTGYGVSPAEAVGIWLFAAAMGSGIVVLVWRSGGARGAQVEPGPFPWRRVRNDNLLGLLLIALLAVGRLPASLIALVGVAMFVGGNGMWVGKWLWANRLQRERKTEEGGGQ